MTVGVALPRCECSLKAPHYDSAYTGGTVRAVSGVGAPVAWQIPRGTFMPCMDDVCAEIAAALDAVAGGTGTWVAERLADVTDGIRIRRADGGHFDLPHITPPLIDHCALLVAYSNVTAADSYAPPTTIWQPAAPLASPDCDYLHIRCVGSVPGQPIQANPLVTQQFFRAKALVEREALDHARAFLRRIQGGVPFRLWVSTAVDEPWSESQRCGYLDLVLHEDLTDLAESWVDEPAACLCGFALYARVPGIVAAVTDGDWRSVLRERTGRHRLGVHIDGCPKFFVDVTPIHPSLGSPWDPPTDPQGHAFDVLEALIPTQDLSTQESTWNPKDGVTAGGAFAFDLLGTPAVRALFASKLTTGHRTRLVGDLDYCTGIEPDDYVVPVESTDGFASSGFIWSHLECQWYDSKGAAQFGNGSSDHLHRGVFAWRSDSQLSRRARSNQGNFRSAHYITDYVPEWRGRRVTVFLWQCDDAGRALDAGYQGPHEIEIRSGWIRSAGPADDTWQTIRVQCDALEDPLSREIGQYKQTARVGTDGMQPSFAVDSPQYFCGIAWNGTAVNDSARDPIPVLDEVGNPLAGVFGAAYLLRRALVALVARVNALAGSAVLAATITDAGIQWSYAGGTDTLQVGTGRLDAREDAPRASFITSIIGISFGPPNPDSYLSPWNRTDTPWNETPVATTQWGLPSRATQIPVWPDPPEDGQPRVFPQVSYGLLEQDGRREAIRWTSATIHDDGSVVIEDVRRAQLGSTAMFVSLWDPAGSDRHPFGIDANPEMRAGTVQSGTLTVCSGWDRVGVFALLLRILLSTGTGGAHGSYDVEDEETGLGLDPACIDIDSFLRFAAARDRAQDVRTFLLSDRLAVEELIRREGLLLGFGILARTGADGRYRIGLITLDVPTETAAALTLSDQDGSILVAPLPKLRDTDSRMLTVIRADLWRDPLTGDSTGPPLVLVDTQGRADSNQGETLDLDVPGLPQDNNTVVTLMRALGERIFGLWARPYQILQIATDRRGLAANPGDVAAVTLASIPTQWSAGGGLVAARALIVAVARDWTALGTDAAAVLTALVFRTCKGIAPSWQVSAYSAGPPVTVTLADSVYTAPGDSSPAGTLPCRDWHHGPAAVPWGVYIYRRGYWAEGEVHAVQPTGVDGTWELLTGPLGWTPGAADTIVEPLAYDELLLAEDQRQYCYIADDGTPPTIGADADPAQEWTP